VGSVLVTGGTGTLGRQLVPRLLAAGHEVRVLSRRADASAPDGATVFRGDIRTGDGIAAAMQGADAVVHAASNPTRQMRETEVEGARNVCNTARATGAHVVYVSIVGVDRHRYPYYRAKLAAEEIVAGSGAPWTVLRATQFHDLIELFFSKGWFISTRHLAFQPVDAGEVAVRLVELVGAGPQQLVPEFGGPEILSVRELAETRRRITGRGVRLVPVPRVGWLADFDRGAHHAPEQRNGQVTWAEWLALHSDR
jgi:uncharacterized protein YbjT (DUF2867 family)